MSISLWPLIVEQSWQSTGEPVLSSIPGEYGVFWLYRGSTITKSETTNVEWSSPRGLSEVVVRVRWPRSQRLPRQERAGIQHGHKLLIVEGHPYVRAVQWSKYIFFQFSVASEEAVRQAYQKTAR